MTIRILVPASCLVLLLGAAVLAQESGARRIGGFGRTIAEELRLGDTRVVLPMNAGPPLWAYPPSGVSLEAFWIEACPFVAVLQIASVRSGLVYRADMDIKVLEHAPSITAEMLTNVPASEDDATWIASTIRARVERVLKGGVKPGVELVFEEDGGTATVRGVEVTAIVPWKRSMVAGPRYIVFGALTERGELRRTRAFGEAPSSGRLVSLGPQGERSRLEGLTLKQALTYLGSEMHKPLARP
ncbi:MAG TPA: hypothetical protein VFV95_19215 [Vicinamibacterales bacterium]|nr:hypothetical protein [Vicinamibacterales bacterium]